MNDFRKWPKANIDVLVGGTPCQSFSVAGLRQGMADPRGNLALVYLALTEQYRPRWLVWENVPGVLSTDGGRDFGSIIGGMVELGYGIAYRVLDAQYFGVPQRRRRVFVIGYLGDWRRAAQVLFEPQSLRRNPPPSREARQIAPTVPSRSTAGGGLGTDFDCDGGLIHCPDVSPAMKARDHKGPSSDGDGDGLPLLAHSLRGEGFDASEDGTGRGTPIVVHGTQDPCTGDQAFALGLNHGGENVVSRPLLGKANDSHDESKQTYVFKQGQGAKAGSIGGNENIAPTLGAAESGTNRTPALMNGAAVRRLTPLECERLQGFPDGYTDIPGASDSGRYKALGNSMAVPVMRWIGERITAVCQGPGTS